MYLYIHCVFQKCKITKCSCADFTPCENQEVLSTNINRAARIATSMRTETGPKRIDPRCIIPMTSVSRKLPQKMASIWVFPKFWGTPQWMVSFLKCLVKWMIWGYTRFRKHPYVSGLFFFGTQILSHTAPTTF